MGNCGSAERWKERKYHISFLKQEANQFQNSTQIYKFKLSPKDRPHRNTHSVLYLTMSLSAQGCTSAPQAQIFLKLYIGLVVSDYLDLHPWEANFWIFLNIQTLGNGKWTCRYTGDAGERDEWDINTIFLDIKHSGLAQQNADNLKSHRAKIYWFSTSQLQE